MLEPVKFEAGELNDYMNAMGRDLFTAPLRETLTQFEEADNFGSLIMPALTDVAGVRQIIESKDVGSNLFLRDVHERVQVALRMVDYVSPKYHVVAANPPYMGAGGMNSRLKAWIRENYPSASSDLMTCFMERSRKLTKPNGVWGMINLPSWMFLSSFEELRFEFLKQTEVLSLIHLGRGIFGADFGAVAFCLKNAPPSDRASGVYRRLFERSSIVRSPEEIASLFKEADYGRYVCAQKHLLRIPGAPIAYWVSDREFEIVEQEEPLSCVSDARVGLQTSDNERFLRYWHEVSQDRASHTARDLNSAKASGARWFPCNKGGEFRKWYGNQTHYVDWENDGERVRKMASPDSSKSLFGKSRMSVSADEDAAHGDVDHGG